MTLETALYMAPIAFIATMGLRFLSALVIGLDVFPTESTIKLANTMTAISVFTSWYLALTVLTILFYTLEYNLPQYLPWIGQ